MPKQLNEIMNRINTVYDRFHTEGVKKAGTDLRKLLQELKGAAQDLRVETLLTQKEMPTKTRVKKVVEEPVLEVVDDVPLEVVESEETEPVKKVRKSRKPRV